MHFVIEIHCTGYFLAKKSEQFDAPVEFTGH